MPDSGDGGILPGDAEFSGGSAEAGGLYLKSLFSNTSQDEVLSVIKKLSRVAYKTYIC